MEIKEKKKTKNLIRNILKEYRSSLSDEFVKANSETICKKVLQSKEYATSQNILCYMAIKNEVNVLPIIEQALLDGKSVYLPKVFGKLMDFYRIEDINHCKEGAFGILEPLESDVFKLDNGLAIVPLVGFDSKCHRIGFGSGYYDRYFEKHNNLIKMAVAYDCQRTDTPFEIDKYDIKMDYIYTPTNIYGGK